jgi:hypothetical protein
MKLWRVTSAIGLAALLLGFALSGENSRAQSEATPPPPAAGQNVMYLRTGPGPVIANDALDFIGFGQDLAGKTVTGAPFSATFSTERTQVLADGNRIQRATTGTITRDSQGRTRREMTLPAIGPWAASARSAPHVVFINDVVAGTQYVLDTDLKIAHKLRPFGHGNHLQIERRTGMPPADQGNVTTVSLGTRTVNGVIANGTRDTRTIPAGQIGNEKPIVITTERWYSPDLQTTVMSKRSDPRIGETLFELTNIQRKEPDASLFQVPSDYTVKQGGPRAGIVLRRCPCQEPVPESKPVQPPQK